MNNFDSIKKSLEFLKERFHEYYEKNNVMLPDRFSRREYAFVFFGGRGMMRHIGFNKKSDVNSFIRRKTPMHAYYSSAYYKIPDAAKMQDKDWMGAELIFDLDSDHLPNAEKMSYEEQIYKVKEEFEKLVFDFLLNDFGFEKKHTELYFSGGRGYHAHIKDPKILNLDSSARREIVDYITGRDLREKLVFQEHVTGTKSYQGKRYPSTKSLKMPPPNSPGWKGRISRGIIDIVSEIKKSSDPYEKLKEYGVGHSAAEKLLEDLSDERVERIRKGNLDQTKTIRKFFLNNALRKTAVTMSAGETDEPVTCDIKRLIRLPGSLHGKTGFKVEEINIDNLSDFDPLSKTIVFSDEKVEVNMKNNFKIKLNNKEFNLNEGKNKVPEYLAVFLIGRKIATII